MSAAQYDLTIPAGSSWEQLLIWESGEPSTPVNLSGYSARMQIRQNYASNTVVFELTTANNRISLGTSSGEITLTASATETAAISSGRYVYDLEVVSPSGLVTRILQGYINITPEVTR